MWFMLDWQKELKLFLFCSNMIVASAQEQEESSQLKTTGRKIEIIEINTDRQCNQLKNRKFYENFSEYANFSTFSGKGHKTKDQFL